jgi:hypothetical protein
LWFLSVGAAACGSDSGDAAGACGDFDACGGAIKGSWKLKDACFIILEQPSISSCPSATADLHAKKSSGSLTVDEDTYERHIEIETELTLTLPKECQKSGTSCSEQGGALKNGGTLVCKDGSAGGCECTTTLTSTFNDAGAYTVRGTKVELVSESVEYCSKGNTLTLRPTVSISMSGTVGTTSQLQTTFEKN